MCFTDTLVNSSVLRERFWCFLCATTCSSRFLASAVDAREALERQLGEKFEDQEFNFGLKEWYTNTETPETPDNEHQKN